MRGGWKNQEDTSLPQYMISIKSSTRSGIYISSNSLVELENIQIENNKDGIQVGKNSSLKLKSSVINLNNDDGIDGDKIVLIDLEDTIVSNNGDDGIDVSKNSFLRLIKSDILTNNDKGIDISRNSQLEIISSNISLNQNNGIGIYNNSILTFEKWDECNENTVISNNNSEGLQSSKNLQILFDSDLGI